MRCFPALTPAEIRRLRVYEWWQVAIAADQWIKDRQQQARRNKQRPSSRRSQ